MRLATAQDVVALAYDVVMHGNASDFRKFRKVINDAQRIRKYYKLALFQPYEYQRTWFRSGATHLLRYLSAANRIGKTFSAAAEFTYHATGDYPSDWDGFRCGPGTLWAVGISTDAVRTVLQKELLGTDDAKQEKKYGTGTIPKHLIISVERDGHRVKSMRIRHVSGEESDIHFYAATQDETVFMGQTCVFIWVDEQSPNEQALIAQCTTRTTTTKGCVAVTATPEQGASDFYIQCRDDNTGQIWFQNATWNDAPHISSEMKSSMLARIPYFQRKMRSEGIPIAGVGAIYPYTDEVLFCNPFPIPDHWLVIRACDFGYSGIADPSTLVDVAYDPATGNRYVFGEWVSDGKYYGDLLEREVYGNSHMPHYMAHKIVGVQPNDWTEATNGEHEFRALGLPSIVVKVPHDGAGIVPGTQATRIETMRTIGANVHHEIFELPPELAPLETNRRSLVGSIGVVCLWMQDNKVKIFNNLPRIQREIRGYQWTKKGERTVPMDKDNHCMDAMRIGLCRVHVDGNTGYEAMQPMSSQLWQDSNQFDEDMQGYNL